MKCLATVLLFVLLTGAPACARPAPRYPVEHPELRQAREHLRSGDAAQAEKIARGVLLQARDSAVMAHAWALVGLAAERLGNCTASVTALRQSMFEPSFLGDELPLVQLALARCLKRQGRLAPAQREAELALAGLNGVARALAYEIIAEAAIARRENARAAQALARAWQSAPAERRPVLQRLAGRLGENNGDDLALAFEALAPERFPAGHVALALARRALDAGRQDEARRYLAATGPHLTGDPTLAATADLVRARLEPPAAAPLAPAVAAPAPVTPGTNGSASSLPAPLPPATAPPAAPATPGSTVPPGARPAIVLLAPLTGPAREIGERIARGAALALSAGGAFGAIDLVTRDTRGDPREAVQHVEAAARDARVIAIIGPVLARESEAAAKRSAELGVPMLALSGTLGLTRLGPTVFRCFLTPIRQAQALARHAVKAGHKRFAILHPRTPYGEAARAAFAEEVARLGGVVATAVGYARGQTKFRAEARSLRAHRFTALFFPEGYRTVAIATGYLAVERIPIGDLGGDKEVQLLGTNEWYADDLLRLAGRYVQRAILAVGFTAQSVRGEALAFTRAYDAAHGGTPTYIEAFAYDAVRLVHTVAGRGAPLERMEIARTLASAQAEGATGTLGFDAQREPTTTPALVRVEGNSFRALE